MSILKRILDEGRLGIEVHAGLGKIVVIYIVPSFIRLVYERTHVLL